MKKRFVSRKLKKTQKVLGWKLMTVFLVGIVMLNFLGGLILKVIDKDLMQHVLVSNSVGNNSYDFESLFYNNAFGLKFSSSVQVSNNANLQEVIDDNPLIYIYNTFQTDKYKSNYYNSYNINSVITQADLILQEYLKLEGINAMVELESVAKVLKDNNIMYANSYKGSRILLENAKKDNSTLKYFLDIQMSDYERSVTTISIDDISYAKILFVVGTDNINYETNQRLANLLNEILLKENKEISRGVSLRGGSGYQGVYNQDFDVNALLIQVGGKENSIDEVNRTMRILAKVLKKYMEEYHEEK